MYVCLVIDIDDMCKKKLIKFRASSSTTWNISDTFFKMSFVSFVF